MIGMTTLKIFKDYFENQEKIEHNVIQYPP